MTKPPLVQFSRSFSQTIRSIAARGRLSPMSPAIFSLAILMVTTLNSYAQKDKRKTAPAAYFPEKEWAKKTPEEVGVDAVLLKGAIDFAVAHEASAARDL